MIYLFIFILLGWLIYYYDYKNENNGFKLWFFVTLLIFILVGGLRYRIGGDTVVYLRYYNDLHPIGSISGIDFTKSRFAPGFVIITSIFKTFTEDFTYFQIFHSIIINTVIFFFVKKYCRHFFFCILIYFFYLYVYLVFEQIRESLAVAIFLLAWPWFRNKEWWKWYLASLLAFMFHVSAIIMFILPVITLPGIREIFKFGKRTWYICLILLVIAYVVQTTMFKYIELISVTESMLDRVQTYGELHRSNVFNINRVIGTIIQYIAYPLLAMYVIYFMRKSGLSYFKDDNELNKECMMALMSVYISIFSIFVGIFVRYNNYFYLFAAIIISDWVFTRIYLFKKFLRMGYLYWILLFLPMLTLNIYYTYMTPVNKSKTLYNFMRYYPYSSVLDKKIDTDREKTIRYYERH